MGSSSPLMPVGFRFHPTDEELVNHYLKHMLLGTDSSVHNVIPLIDVCDFEPWDLPAFSKIISDDHEWFFFSPLGLKFTSDTRNRYNRKTNAGYWKPTGKDRSIKTRGTNNVIGTKKTLVFYKGRGPHGVKKTNWVIHEYHAVTIPHDKRGIVLCRLIEKPEKKLERRADTWIHDEGEPSGYVPADSENQATSARILNVHTSPELNPESIFATPPLAEEYGLQPVIVTEQEPASQDSTFPNAYFGKENNISQISFETIKEDDNLDYIKMFLNDSLAGEEAFVDEETIPASANDSTPAHSWKNAYYGREPLSAEQGKNLGSSSFVYNEHNGSKEKPLILMAKSLHEAPNASPPPVSSRNETNLEKNDSTSDDSLGLDTLGDITPLDMFLIQSNYYEKSINCITLVSDSPEEHSDVSDEEVSPQEAQKETAILKSKKQQRKGLETARDQSPAVNEKGSSTYLETPLSAKLFQHDKIPDTTSVPNEHTDSREKLVMSIIESPQPHNDSNIEEKDSTTSDDEIWGLYAYSDSDSKRRLLMYIIRRSWSSPSPPTTRSPSPPTTRSPSPVARGQNEYHPRSCNFVSLRADSGKPQTKRNILSQALSQQEAQKEAHILVINKVQRKAQGTNWRKKLKTTSNLLPGVFGKGSFIHLETSLVQSSWSLFTWSCVWPCWHGSEFHHDKLGFII